MTQLAQQMMMMAQYYKFDGWLINIENPINVSAYLSVNERHCENKKNQQAGRAQVRMYTHKRHSLLIIMHQEYWNLL